MEFRAKVAGFSLLRVGGGGVEGIGGVPPPAENLIIPLQLEKFPQVDSPHQKLIPSTLNNNFQVVTE